MWNGKNAETAVSRNMGGIHMKKAHWKRALAGLAGAAVLTQTGIFSVAADLFLTGYKGDVNRDGELSVVDIVQLQRNLLGDLPFASAEITEWADMNEDGAVNVIDLGMLKKCVLTGYWHGVYEEIEVTEPTEPPTEYIEPTEPPTEYIEPTTEAPIEDREHITAPMASMGGSLPSQGTANLVVFYVDFPDCRYSYDPGEALIEEIAFGEENLSEAKFPFDSFSAFYSRSSKGAMQLTGKVFRYTTQENQAAYDTDKEKLTKECFDAFAASEDFAQFDGDGDGKIDATLFTVPTAAGDDNWWPCAGPSGTIISGYQVDGKSVGHIITGNAQINSETDYTNFLSSYLHEMGHCMGLPDYYMYYSDDYEGMHGSAGTELMDSDAYSDFGCFSKLMLGWYFDDQVQVYDASAGSQTFTLHNAQTENGNCVIIPYGELADGYHSEYMMVEFVTPDGNNAGINRDMWWWQNIESGIRVYHVKADKEIDTYWGDYLKYQNGSYYTNYDDSGIRLLRLANDAEGGSVFTTGDVIDGNVSGFHWYDSSENETIETGFTITVGELTSEGYTITVSNN